MFLENSVQMATVYVYRPNSGTIRRYPSNLTCTFSDSEFEPKYFKILTTLCSFFNFEKKKFCLVCNDVMIDYDFYC